MHADEIAASMTSLFQELIPQVPGGRIVRKNRAVASVTGMPVAALNTIWLEQPNPDAGDVAALLDELGATGLPYRLGLRPASDGRLARLATARGMVASGEVPLMAIGSASGEVKVPAPAGLSIRRLGPDETSLHAMVASPVFDIDEEITLALVNPGTLRLDTVRCYAGERDGQPVVTGMSVTVGGCTAILNVATLPGLRGLGYGTALTARAVADGLAAGSACCWLQSSPDGYHVYQKLGFQTIESWPYYSA